MFVASGLDIQELAAETFSYWQQYFEKKGYSVYTNPLNINIKIGDFYVHVKNALKEFESFVWWDEHKYRVLVNPVGVPNATLWSELNIDFAHIKSSVIKALAHCFVATICVYNKKNEA